MIAVARVTANGRVRTTTSGQDRYTGGIVLTDDPDRKAAVVAEARGATVAAESRYASIVTEKRSAAVEAESRSAAVLAETRLAQAIKE